MNKKGFLRIIEAVIAIVLILGFILYINYKTPENKLGVPDQVRSSMDSILNQLSLNSESYGSFRDCILKSDTSKCGIEGSEPENCECLNVFSNTNLGKCGLGTNFNDLMNTRISGYDYACEVCSESLSCTKINEKIPKSKTVYTDTIFIAPTKDVNNEPRVVRLYFWEK